MLNHGHEEEVQVEEGCEEVIRALSSEKRQSGQTAGRFVFCRAPALSRK